MWSRHGGNRKQLCISVDAGCSPRWQTVGDGGGGGDSPPLRHDWRGNGLLALPHVVDFTTESHPSTSVVVREGAGGLRGRASAVTLMHRYTIYRHRFDVKPTLTFYSTSVYTVDSICGGIFKCFHVPY